MYTAVMYFHRYIHTYIFGSDREANRPTVGSLMKDNWGTLDQASHSAKLR